MFDKWLHKTPAQPAKPAPPHDALFIVKAAQDFLAKALHPELRQSAVEGIGHHLSAAAERDIRGAFSAASTAVEHADKKTKPQALENWKVYADVLGAHDPVGLMDSASRAAQSKDKDLRAPAIERIIQHADAAAIKNPASAIKALAIAASHAEEASGLHKQALQGWKKHFDMAAPEIRKAGAVDGPSASAETLQMQWRSFNVTQGTSATSGIFAMNGKTSN